MHVKSKRLVGHDLAIVTIDTASAAFTTYAHKIEGFEIAGLEQTRVPICYTGWEINLTLAAVSIRRGRVRVAVSGLSTGHGDWSCVHLLARCNLSCVGPDARATGIRVGKGLLAPVEHAHPQLSELTLWEGRAFL